VSTQDNEIVRTEAIAKDYGLKEPLAREIVLEETRRALRRSKLAWLILVAGIGLAGWLYAQPAVDRGNAIWALIGTFALWMAVGRYLASPAIRQAAAEKAARLQGSGG
jgi:hypothetical protein